MGALLKKKTPFVLGGAGLILFTVYVVFRIGSLSHADIDPNDARAPLPPRDLLTSRRPAASAPTAPLAEGAVDLLELVDLTKDSLSGLSGFFGRALITDGEAWSRVQVPCRPPEEYDLRLLVTRKRGGDSLNVGFVHAGRQGMFNIDGNASTATWLSKTVRDRYHPEWIPGKILMRNAPSTVVISVRRSSVSLKIDGRSVIHWTGDPAELDLPPGFRVPDSRSLILASWGTQYRIDEAVLLPLSGKPELTR